MGSRGGASLLRSWVEAFQLRNGFGTSWNLQFVGVCACSFVHGKRSREMTSQAFNYFLAFHVAWSERGSMQGA